MPVAQETAYPRLKSSPSSKELKAIYSPTPDELLLAKQNTKNQETQLSFLILLKTFQRLGYATPIATVPPRIIQHISKICQISISSTELQEYDGSKSRTRHLTVIRDYLGINIYGRKATKVMVQTMETAVTTLQDLVDIINVSLEELIRQRYELPGFTTLERMARKIRKSYTEQLYKQIIRPLNKRHRTQLDALFIVSNDTANTLWNDLKQEPGQPTLGELKDLIERLNWLTDLGLQTASLVTIPDAKVKHLAAEARALEASQMKRLVPEKRYSLALAFLTTQHAQTLDDLAEMFIKRMNSMHHKASGTLQDYRKEHQERTDGLISTLKDLVTAFTSEADLAHRLMNMTDVISAYGYSLLDDCEAHLDHTGNNYLPFLKRFYSSHRASL